MLQNKINNFVFCDLDEKNCQIWKNHWDAVLGLIFVEHLGVFESPPPTQSLVLENNQPANMEKDASKNH